MTTRIEFSKATKRLVAERCAYRCAFPSCNKLTIGPGPTSDTTTITGEAAHISSASPGGPRGRQGLTDDEVRSVENAIWLCLYHAKLVDTHRGESFPPESLLSFKGLCEARVSREQNDISAPFGWFHELVIRESPIFSRDARLHFGKVTVVVGDNASGKTAICEWLSALADPAALGRWEHPTGSPLRLDVTLFDPQERHLQLSVPEPGVVQYFLHGKEIPFYPFKLGLVRVPHYTVPSWTFLEKPIDEVNFVSDILGLYPSITRNLICQVNQYNEGSFLDLHVIQEGDQLRIVARDEKRSKPSSFIQMSDSMRAMLLIELGAAAARFSARFMPTILLLDGGVRSLDSWHFSRYVQYLIAPMQSFQTIVMLIQPPPRDQSIPWPGWEFARLLGKKRAVVIEQTPF